MISLDTNVLVRILVADDPKQTQQAMKLLEHLDGDDEKAHVSDIVLCELVWVLGKGYGHVRAKIALALRPDRALADLEPRGQLDLARDQLARLPLAGVEALEQQVLDLPIQR